MMETLEEDWDWLWYFGCKEIHIYHDRIDFDFAYLRYNIENETYGIGFSHSFKPIIERVESISDLKEISKLKDQLIEQIINQHSIKKDE